MTATYVETDFLFAVAKPDDWLSEEVEAVLGERTVETSLLAYAEFLVAAYTEDEGFDFEVAPLVANMLDMVPLPSAKDEEVLLAAATYLDDHDLTPFDALHAAHASIRHEGVLVGSDLSYDALSDIERHQLESE
ncbi:PIN domain-containing protein [Halorubrum aquaticum]|uniref:PIN domain-containing protein n=1 Tax=Halorubrum aquaticum TaxID=387340 RepID=A0A1I3B4Q3_9EURY|nr:PIN domain-containing protein [Halorubrum aquaticum]SFH56691.1 PIN domain-containing protein [Halorubrum aquaticum]